MRRLLALIAVSIALAVHAQSALAITVEVGRVGGVTWDLTDPLVATSTLSAPDENGMQTWQLTSAFVKSAYTVNSFTAQLKEDPFVTNNIVLTNTSGATATFTATVLLPITAFAYDTVVFSSLGVTATDSNGDGSLLFDVSGSTPIYNGFVNFPVSTTLLSMNPTGPGTLPITTADCSPFVTPGCSATSSNGVASLAVTPGVASFIGLTLTFQLSNGDSAGITSRFEIVSVPEPATLALLGLVGVAVAVAKRRAA